MSQMNIDDDGGDVYNCAFSFFFPLQSFHIATFHIQSEIIYISLHYIYCACFV